ncbi:hypothetical protein ACVOZ6_004701 [Escherichia coli]
MTAKEAALLRAENEDYFLLRPPGSLFRDKNRVYLSDEDEALSRRALQVIQAKCGAYVDSYPEWHPFMACRNEEGRRHNSPYSPPIPHLDHTRYMVNGFITCPYGHGVNELLEAVKKGYSWVETHKADDSGFIYSDSLWRMLATDMVSVKAAFITEELIEYLEDGGEACGYSYTHYTREELTAPNSDAKLIHLYGNSAYPILVWLEWEERYAPLEDSTISPAAALPLMLARSLADMSNAQVSETWESMAGLLLGRPNTGHASPLVNRKTTTLLRKAFTGLMETGAFGDYWG